MICRIALSAALLSFLLAVPLPSARPALAQTPPEESAPRAPRALPGVVLDAETGRPLADVRVRTVGVPAADVRETTTNADGVFRLERLPVAPVEIEATRLGYLPQRVLVDLSDPGVDPAATATLRLTPRPLPLPGIEVTTTRAVERESPVAFTELDREKVRERYWGQDVPMLLAETPGVYAYSDAGNGVGYSYVKIRGFSQRRVAVTINGIPLNTPESKEVYWVDHPDLLASAANVQVQRGVGSALYGASAVGGSINIETLGVPRERRFAVETGGGSYGTQRFAAQFQSGILDNTYALSGRYSRILSDGYREQSWSRLWSYYLSAARLDPWMTTRVNFYGGPEELHLAFFAVDRAYLDGRISGDADRDRRFNPLTWRNETDNFFEPHYELIQDIRLSDRASLSSSAFYFPGKGFYNDLPFGPQTFASRRLADFYADSDSVYPAAYYKLDGGGQPELQPNGRYLIVAADMTQRLWLRNRHYGWVPRAKIRHGRGELTFGGEWREHTGRHWGELTWAAALPPGTNPNHVFYDYTGRVNVVSGFAQEAFDVRPDVRVTGSLQWRRTRYAIGRDRYNGYDFDLAYSFLNPRLGANWNVSDRWNVFASYAHMRAEPILSEIYRADDPTSVPLFRRLDPANHVYEDPLIDPERLNDFEAGIGYRRGDTVLRLTGFWLDFRNEIVPSGQIDALGNPITGNAARSTHKGIEAEFGARHRTGFEIGGNVTLGRNRFDDYREYVDAATFNDYGGNAIAGFPDRMANLTVGYRTRGARAALTLVETGRQYLDNSEDNRKNPSLRQVPGYQKKFIEEHAVLNGTFSLDLTEIAGARLFGERSLALDVHAMNLTDLRYETAGYVFAEVPYFYPASRRSVFVALRAEF
jgi:iron complex outermembrane receptor protein